MLIAGDQPMNSVSPMRWYHVIHWQRLFFYHYFGFLSSTVTLPFKKFAENHYLPLFKIRVKVENEFRLHPERNGHKDKSSHLGLISFKKARKSFPLYNCRFFYQGLYFSWSDSHRAKKKTGKIWFDNVSFIPSALGVPPLRYGTATELGICCYSGHMCRAEPFPK